jgi:hypothetical protein
MANSLVGATTNDLTLPGFSSKALIIGITKVAVLPVPVLDKPIKSLPC